MPQYTQQYRKVAVSSPLGDDVLLLRSMNGTERLSRLFHYNLTLVSEEQSINFADIVGQNMTVQLELPDDRTRYFNGYVSRFVQTRAEGDLAEYQATIVPWLWLLTRTADCRIFQEKTVPEIIKEVFRDAGFTDFDDSLSGSYRTREYCVQYRETDFNFVSRLMEQEGIYYFFEHAEGKHTLVLADSLSAHQTFPGYEEIPYRPAGSTSPIEHIGGWTLEQAIQPGVYALNDYDFEKPKKDLLARSVIQRDHAAADYEIFDYPGEYTENADGDSYAKVRIQELQASHEIVSSESDAWGICSGYTFKVTDHTREDQEREYLVMSTTIHFESDLYHSAAGGGGGVFFQCQFSAMDSSQPFRPPRVTPKPVIQGPQTAVVVGKDGEEIWTEKHGRVKLQFHWDRYGESDEESSCWIRVSQPWAGANWGGVFLPRIGQEVIVEFLEGDPDRPIITGRVYNGDNMYPYALPDNQTQSGFKSRSSKDGSGDNFNEIRFEDKKDKEEIYVHAERDYNRVVENNDTLKVGFDDKDKGDQTIEIHNNQVLVVGNSDSDDGSQTIEIWNNRTETVKEGDETITIAKGDRTETVSKGNETITIAEGNRTETVSKGNESITIAEGDRDLTVTKGNDTITIGNNQTTKVKKNILIDAGDQILIKTGKASILMKKDGTINIEGKDITIKGSGQITIKASKDIVMKGKKILEN
ncbi:MAG: type VI secretion system tip protein TssI/VgrG [Phycisphaerales bacterium]